ncbi:hypothetical protein FSP39_010039 [Pinctada imbricata]|uniref:RRM domain-containing protein n=1 Tax=Pinctada imbricata TaxID=66713 RepID=A0AA88XJT1_PINIB|nr:hypothetical protein FSP39_010039 [Pinctada imbricata]
MITSSGGIGELIDKQKIVKEDLVMLFLMVLSLFLCVKRPLNKVSGNDEGMKEDRLRKMFGTKGTLTDCSLKYTKDGKFRKFAFVGYRNPEEAEAAIKEYNNTYVDTSKIQVEFAKDFGDCNKPRSWSKYSYDSSAFQKMMKEKEKKKEKEERKKKPKKKDKAVDDMLGELKDDPKFAEFLEAHQRSNKKSVWDNDAMETKVKGHMEENKGNESDSAVEMKSDEEDEDDKEDYEDEEGSSSDEEQESDKKKGINTASKTELSDLDYLKSKVSNKNLLSDSSDDDEDKEDDSSDDNNDNNDDKSDDEEMSSDEDRKTTISKKSKADREKKTVDMPQGTDRGNKKTIKAFFNPVQPTYTKIPKSAKGRPIGIAFVDFPSSVDMEKAMARNKNFMKNKRIFLNRCTGETDGETSKKSEHDNSPQQQKIQSGRLYLRNLPYVCTEEDLENLFKSYGPITEVHVPIDSLTKKTKGFAFVTFMIPEHAVRAFSALDGTSFMGRMLHILPAKEKKEEDFDNSEGSSFKNKKKKKEKQQASSSHNWNTLFLGSSAVADVMADKYNTEKSHILDAEAKQSLGVRMALGETEIVAETRKFLVENGVMLDSFSQAAGERSKTVLLVKNLPARTDVEELRSIFSKYGSVGRVILPPSGITAIVEYLEPTEAKSGFRNLAYTKFHHVPLYLEWAPMEMLKPKEETEKMSDSAEKQSQMKKAEEEDSDSEDESPEPESTLFVKNLNFETTEETLKEKFSKCGIVRNVTIAKKKDTKMPGQMLSMGYGFVEYMKRENAMKALKTLQLTDIEGHRVELKISNRTTAVADKGTTKRKQKEIKQKTSNILVRNIPFEATKKEIFELFKVFGELKSVRLPKKAGGTGTHRGFGFIDFLTKQDAKRAFDALCHSTHLYGRRLNLEWAESAEDIDTLRKKTAEHYHDDVPKKRVKKSAIVDSLQKSTAD